MFGWIRSLRAVALLAALVLLLADPGSSGAVGQEEDVLVGSVNDTGKLVSLDVQDAEIETVLRSLASFSGMNIVASPRVEGKVTVRLDSVPWQQALTVILRAHNFDYVEEYGILRVDTLDELRKEELEQKRAEKQVEDLVKLELTHIPLDYANASEVKESLTKMLSGRGTIDVDERTNTLLVNDIPDRLAMIRSTAKDLDSITPQVEINARLLDIDSRASRDLGVTWAVSNFKDANTNLVGDMGVNAPVQDPAGVLRIGTVQSYADLVAKLDFLERENLAHIIANPIITTTDNREAKILVGQKIPLIVADEAGNAITQLTTIGIQLQVTPHINDDRWITLDVHNEVSDLSSQATVQGGVIINTTEADTRVLVGHGETAVIAGLVRNVESILETGVPVLRSVPLLGYLFKSRSTVSADRELIVFLTPRIATEEYMTRRALILNPESEPGFNSLPQ
jgi:type IV pilus assembly protein PilQ